MSEPDRGGGRTEIKKDRSEFKHFSEANIMSLFKLNLTGRSNSRPNISLSQLTGG